MGRSTRLRITHRVHEKGGKIVCGFEREAGSCFTRLGRAELPIQLARYDCVCVVQLYRGSSRAFTSHSNCRALTYGGQLP
jgi:hypothetical protein